MYLFYVSQYNTSIIQICGLFFTFYLKSTIILNYVQSKLYLSSLINLSHNILLFKDLHILKL